MKRRQVRISCSGVFAGGTDVISYLVAQALGGNDGDLIADTLVGVEVKGEAGVVAFCAS
jgi:hypothetical protein